jgi:hypothetical protein
MALTFEVAIKDYFTMRQTVKMLIWKVIMRDARYRQNQLNEELSYGDDLFAIDEVLRLIIEEYKQLEWYEAVQATIDCAEYYDIDLN